MINLEEYLNQIITEDYQRDKISYELYHLAITIILYAEYSVIQRFYSYYELFRVGEYSEEQMFEIFYMYE